ncbi:MAG: exosome complex RNA-binding protein Rrp4 [Candidatus Aenigmarchaeota archaeon]|nr:exosome complex RNA-binding protein Rrp4 [Candidatus Aenigmarchaeota archaeon]MCX8179218.1 exosome complex RNA-binding protein Rrp4 [Candidatus Aenigmarchaeota archaeon]
MTKQNNGVREIAYPGQILGSSKEYLASHGTYIDEQGNIVSKYLGILSISGNYISVIPLSGVYVPKPGDHIIGIVTEVEKVGWVVDINSPWLAFLSLSEGVDEFVDLKRVLLNRYYDEGDVIYAQVLSAKKGDIQLSMKGPSFKKLKGGVLVKVTPSKVPRVIGKEGSMINLIKEKTRTIIRVGQNGLVWISGEKVDKAIMTIKRIDEKSHVYGLTEEITKMLSE